MKQSIFAALAALSLVACGQPSEQSAPPEAQAPVQVGAGALDLAAPGGVTANLQHTANANGATLTDRSSTDHGTIFWSLSDVRPNASYVFRLNAGLNPQAANASLLQIDVQSGAEKQQFECAFSVSDGTAIGRNAAANLAVTATSAADAVTVECPITTGASPTAIYAYIAPAIGANVGSYDPATTGSISVRSVDFAIFQ